ncbi:hypothetical protein THAOC_02170 [Thalassiosira oceanica]|uniref:Uncharacterized protein n=1 Tax=Thalassiosira oceanica TaxID=159749 RepID=K0TMC6_THAOC|nr:hypothetical protein THAOC_02170 [Thalassiosira oceanica]|eukprot:EJK76086.1 hypothetical protein THAOC_02170 [Thalassiosira oceanica]
MKTIGSLTALLCAFQSAAMVMGLSLCSSGRRRCRSAAPRVQCSTGTLPRGGAGTTTALFSSSSSTNGDSNVIIDAVVEGKTAGLARGDGEVGGGVKEPRQRKRDMFKQALKDLSTLSLLDYKWRSALFKKNEAERQEEAWMAAMMGEEPAYARPMDASGKFTHELIGRQRARRIAESDGELIRPKDLSRTDEAGPLSELERKAVQFLNDLSDSEVRRVQSGKLRPKDCEDRGPLGEAEAKAVLVLDKVVESEKTRMKQSRLSGQAVRPIDVPGPLGELERYVGDIIRSEKQRARDRDANEGKLVRPKDATLTSGLGEAERRAVEDWEMLKKEEKRRLFNLRRFISERRPMESDADSPIGVTEAFAVGLFRGPRLLAAVADRVKELMASEELGEKDKDFIRSLPPVQSKDLKDDQI